LQSTGQEFTDQLWSIFDQRDRSKTIDNLRIVFLSDKGNEGVVDTLEISLVVVEILTKLVYVIPDDVPSFFEEGVVETIRYRGFVIGEIQNSAVNFFLAEGKTKMIKTGMGNNKSLKVKL
jgi:hypothetical protein